MKRSSSPDSGVLAIPSLVRDVFAFAWNDWFKSTSGRRDSTIPPAVAPTRVFTQVDIFLQEQWFYQYNWRGLLTVEWRGARYVYVPALRLEPEGRPPRRLDSLPTYSVDNAPRWLGFARQRYAMNSAVWHSPLRPSLRGPWLSEAALPADLDIAPLLHRDLLRLAVEEQRERLATAIGFLDLFACFRGSPRANARPPNVLLGAEAVSLLAERLGTATAAAHEDVLRLTSSSAVTQSRSRDRPITVAAVVDRQEKGDGCVGGYDAELVLVTLTISTEDDGWCYEREVLLTESEEGEPMS